MSVSDHSFSPLPTVTPPSLFLDTDLVEEGERDDEADDLYDLMVCIETVEFHFSDSCHSSWVFECDLWTVSDPLIFFYPLVTAGSQ